MAIILRFSIQMHFTTGNIHTAHKAWKMIWMGDKFVAFNHPQPIDCNGYAISNIFKRQFFENLIRHKK